MTHPVLQLIEALSAHPISKFLDRRRPSSAIFLEQVTQRFESLPLPFYRVTVRVIDMLIQHGVTSICPRIRGTIEAIERELVVDGFVLRYRTQRVADGLPPGEGVFLPCSFWLVDCLELIGRSDDARRLFDRLVNLANDVGLLSEEYDPVRKRMVGNFPQAFTHVALVNSAHNLASTGGPARHRSGQPEG